MNIKRNVQIINDKLTNKIDEKLIEYISRYIDDDMSVLEKAVSIYLCLGDVLRYSPSFFLNNDYSKLSLAGDISLDNNEMICKNWSILYKRLLKYYGIKSKLVRRRSHYKVEMILDNVIYSMDTTCYGGSDLHYSMSDTARIQFGFRIENFIVAGHVDPYDVIETKKAMDELDKTIDKIYERQKRKIIPDSRVCELRNKVCDRVKAYGEQVGIGTLEDINYRMKFINRFWGLSINNTGVEKMQLFNSFLNRLFEDYEDYGYEFRRYNLYGFVDGKLLMFKLVAIDINGTFYYLMDDGKKFTCMDKKGVIDEVYNRRLKIDQFTDIIGIYTALEYCRIRCR